MTTSRRACISGMGALTVSAGLRSARAAEPPVQLAQVVDLSGPGSLVGGSWRSGVEMGVQELNARGGLLGRMVQTITFDSQSSAAVSRTMTQRALDGDVYALLGPVSSAAIRLDMPITRQAGIVQIIGGDAADLTLAGNPSVFRTDLGPATYLPKLANWARDSLRARRVAVLWTGSEPGRAGRDGFVRALAGTGLELAADLLTDAGRPDLSEDFGRIVRSGADAVFVSGTEEDCARIVVEARRRTMTLPLFGDAALVSPKVAAIARDAASGVRGHVGLPADAPAPALAAFRGRYAALNKDQPDTHATRGYLAVAIVAGATAKLGRLDAHALAETLHGLTITTAMEPGILLDTSWDAAGDMDRASWIVELRDGKPVVVETLPPLRAG